MDFNNLSIIIAKNEIMVPSDVEAAMVPDSVSKHISVEIHVDNKLFYKNDSLLMPYEFTKYRVGIGRHKLEVIFDSVFVHKTHIWVLPMKWMVIEYPMHNDEEKILITSSLSPIGLM